MISRDSSVPPGGNCISLPSRPARLFIGAACGPARDGRIMNLARGVRGYVRRKWGCSTLSQRGPVEAPQTSYDEREVEERHLLLRKWPCF